MNVILNLCVFSAEKEGDLKRKNTSFSLFLQDFFSLYFSSFQNNMHVLLFEAKFNVIYTDLIITSCYALLELMITIKLLLFKMSKICQSLRIVLRVSLRNL